MRQVRKTFTRPASRGFTLIEAALTTVIVGVGFMAMLQLIATGTLTNLRGAETTTAMNLAKNVRERSLKLPFTQIMTLNGQTYTPPIDSRGEALSDFPNWTQQVTVQAVDPDRLTLDISDVSPSAVRVTVRTTHNGNAVCDVSWYALTGTP